MAIVQEAFYIPEDIATGLATGVYCRVGGVIRHAAGSNKGQIVKFLDPVNLNRNKQTQGIGVKAAQFIQQHKKETGILTIGALFMGVAIWGYQKWKNHEPKELVEFKTSMNKYIDAIRNGCLNIEIIESMMNALESIKKSKNYKKITIQFTADDLEILVGHIYDYTAKLAADNSIDISNEEIKLKESAIINLESYLNIQKKIFENIA